MKELPPSQGKGSQSLKGNRKRGSALESQKVGVIGCGAMGSGIIQVCAQSGYQAVVLEVNYKLLPEGLSLIDSALTKVVDKGKLAQRRKGVHTQPH